MPAVSVVMPAYNAERTLEAAVRSVLGQSFGDLELIVVDDGSTDGTYALACALAAGDGRLRVYRNDPNAGVSATRARGVALSSAAWIAFLDSDDLWRRDKLEKQLAQRARQPDAALFYTASAFISEDGRPYSYILRAQERTTYATLLRRNLISCSSVLVRKDALAGVRLGPDDMHEDYAAWLQLLRGGGFACGLDEPLLIYRLSKSSRSGARLRSAKMLYRSYRFVGYGPAAAALLSLRYAVHSIGKRRHIRRSATPITGDETFESPV